MFKTFLKLVFLKAFEYSGHMPEKGVLLLQYSFLGKFESHKVPNLAVKADESPIAFCFFVKKEWLVHHVLEYCHDSVGNCSSKAWGAFYEQHRVTLLAHPSNNVSSLFALFLINSK